MKNKLIVIIITLLMIVTTPRNKLRGFTCPEVPGLDIHQAMLVEAVDF
jgi:hypothetical protein